MPIVKYSEVEFEKLYKEVQRKTKNFSEITPEILSQNPMFIKVFRMLCGRSLGDFGKIISKTHATVAQYERNAIKKIPLIEAERILSKLNDEMPKEKTLENALEKFKKYKQLSNGGYLQAFKRAELADLTNQEKMIKSIFENKSVRYEAHKTLMTSIGELNFDFWLPEKKILIECTESSSKQKAEALGFRIIKLREKIKCTSIVVIPKNVTNGVLRRLSDYDHIIFSSDLSKLENII